MFLSFFLAGSAVYFLFKDKVTRAILEAGCLLIVFMAVLMSCQLIILIVLGARDEPVLADNNNIDSIAGLIYATSPSKTQGFHGLDGYKGNDYSLGCGSTLYSPVPGKATITIIGLDGYNHYDSNTGMTYDQNTWIHIEGDAGTAILLHGDYTGSVGDIVHGGITAIGREASNGWSTGCHTHLVWKPNTNYNKESYPTSLKYPVQSSNSSFEDNGYISAYRKSLSDETLYNRKRWGQVPPDTETNTELVLVAVLDCNQIGMTGTLETRVKTFDVLVYDCAGIEDGGADWMIKGNYVVEVDGYTWEKYPEIIGSLGTLRLR